MAFALENLSPIGGNSRRGKASQHWSYWTLDTAATVDSNQYFNGGSSTPYGGAYNLLERGDVIHRVTWATAIGEGGTISTYGTHIVVDKANGAIDVTDTTAGTVTDTD